MLAACKAARRSSLGSSIQEGGRRGVLPLLCIRWMGLVTGNWGETIHIYTCNLNDALKQHARVQFSWNG